MKHGWWKMTTNKQMSSTKKLLNELPAPSSGLAIPEPINDGISDAESVADAPPLKKGMLSIVAGCPSRLLLSDNGRYYPKPQLKGNISEC